jgi:LPXTG-motif cell wall-anchored protein
LLALVAGTGAAALLGLLASPAQAGEAGEEPPGNKGTVKIHRSSTADSDRRNEPKVCAFRIVGFGFPEDTNLELSIVGHGGPNAGSGSFAGTVEAGDLSPAGDFGVAGPSLPDGMYKLTADNTTAPGSAKHKVFKVDCGGQGPTGGTTGGDTTGGTTGSAAPEQFQQPTGEDTNVLGATVERDVLPRTGRDMSGFAILGSGLIIGGTALLVARRSRMADA